MCHFFGRDESRSKKFLLLYKRIPLIAKGYQVDGSENI